MATQTAWKIIIPEPIEVKTGTIRNDGSDFRRTEHFADFLHDNILPRMGTKLRDIRRAMRLYEAVEKAKPGDEILIEDVVYEKIKAELDKDWSNAFLLQQILPFIDALESAEKVTLEEKPSTAT